MNQASIVLILPDKPSTKIMASNQMYANLRICADTNICLCPNQEKFVEKLNVLTNNFYCKAIIAIGKEFYNGNYLRTLQASNFRVDYPKCVLLKEKNIFYARLGGDTHLFCIQDEKYFFVINDILQKYYITCDNFVHTRLSQEIGVHLKKNNLHLATAESCTGGLIIKTLTDIPGSSDYICGGACTYTAYSKEKILGVWRSTIETYGVVSVETAQAMAIGAQNLYKSEFALSTTGVAGPGSDHDGNPEGLIYIGLATPDDCVVYTYMAENYLPFLDRNAIRIDCVRFALQKLRNVILQCDGPTNSIPRKC